jgi:SAM-dependent methyltransferase
MKKTNWALSATLLFTFSCSSIQSVHERDPAGVFDSCKKAIAGFFGYEGPKVERVALDADRGYVINNHKNNNFTTGRSLEQYMVAFNRLGYASLSLKQDLEKIKMRSDGHWLDAGGGMGFATEQATKAEGTKFKTTLVSVETGAEDILDKSGAVRRKVIKGKFIEDIADEEMPKSDIITDLYGPMAYSSRPDQVLRKYIDNLKQNGVAYIYLGEDLDTFGFFDQIVTRNGKLINLTEWLEAVEGLKVEVIKLDTVFSDTNIIRGEKSRVAKISLKKPSLEIHIPELERLTFQEGSSMDGFIVPRMIFKEIEKGVPPVLPENKSVKNSLRHFVTDFRTGEFEHPVLDQLSSMKSKEWAHFSNEELSWDSLQSVVIKDENYFDMSSNRLLSRFNAAAEKNLRPQLTSIFELTGKKDLKLISDHNGTFVSAASPDKTLKIYLDSLADDGKIVLNMGDENLGLSKVKILNANGSYTTLKKWLDKIPGINVSLKRSKINEQVTRKQILDNGSLKDFISSENAYSEVFVITIKNREQINIPALRYMGKAQVNDRGFELPIYSQ